MQISKVRISCQSSVGQTCQALVVAELPRQSRLKRKSQSNSSIDLRKVLGLNNRQGCFNQSINALSVSPLFPRNSWVCLASMSLTEAEKDACSSASKGQIETTFLSITRCRLFSYILAAGILSAFESSVKIRAEKRLEVIKIKV